jgi:hypothetical protein
MSRARSFPRAATAALALAALLAGCSTTVTLVPEPLACPVKPEVLAQRCTEPATLADGATYQALVKAGIDDRAALRQCAAHDRLLAQALEACDAALETYRQRIREINAKLAAKP